MITLYSYPKLFGVADNNGYGLKVFAFLKLTDVPFVHQHIFDASGAPRGQLPYILDKDEAIGDSDTIIAHLICRYGLTVDDHLTDTQRDTGQYEGTPYLIATAPRRDRGVGCSGDRGTSRRITATGYRQRFRIPAGGEPNEHFCQPTQLWPTGAVRG